MHTGKVFQRRAEDFRCEQCGFAVLGDGYTNHCPSCLYSKHVDIFPGDRLEPCSGLMEPIACVKENGQDRLVHRCLSCGIIRKNKVQDNDSFDSLLGLARKQVLSEL